MPDQNILHIAYRDDGSYDRYRLDRLEGSDDLVVLEHVTPMATSLEPLIAQKRSWFPEDFLSSNVPGPAKEKLKLIRGDPLKKF
jgi:hypothetical protein